MGHIGILVTPSRFNWFFRFGWFGVSWCWIFLTITRTTTTTTTTANCKKLRVLSLHILLIEEFDKWLNRSNPGLETILMISLPLLLRGTKTCCSSSVVRVDDYLRPWKIAIKWEKTPNKPSSVKSWHKTFKTGNWQKRDFIAFWRQQKQRTH